MELSELTVGLDVTVEVLLPILRQFLLLPCIIVLVLDQVHDVDRLV